jgi:hypothetical protein
MEQGLAQYSLPPRGNHIVLSLPLRSPALSEQHHQMMLQPQRQGEYVADSFLII